MIPRPIPESYWVLPSRILAGEYPGAHDLGIARRKVRRLLRAGISQFIDLTQAGEGILKPYLELAEEEALLQRRTIIHQRLPIPDMGVPTQAGMSKILAAIAAGVADGQMMYLHCWGGIGRTGTVVGCYLVEGGLTGLAALDELARLRRGISNGDRPSPETEAQRQFVRTWQPDRANDLL